MKYIILVLSLLCWFIESKCELKEIDINKGITTKIEKKKEYCFYMNIQDMKVDSEGILTLQFEKGLLNSHHIAQINSLITYDFNDLKEKFPIKKEESMFPMETPYESQYDEKLNMIKHLYFTKNIESKNAYLLLYIESDSFGKDTKNDYELNIQPPFFIFKAPNVDVSEEDNPSNFIKSFNTESMIPLYLTSSFPKKIYKHNVLIHSELHLFTYTCNSLLVNNGNNTYSINQNRHYEYSTDIQNLNENGKECSSIIIKFLTSEEHQLYKLFLFYINLPFYSIHSLSPVQQSYSFEYVIENDDELHTLFTYINENEYHLRIEFLYGNLLIYYKSKFGKLLSSYDFDPTQMHNDSKITGVDQVIQLDIGSNFFYLKCKSQMCGIKITIMKLNSKLLSHSFMYSGSYFISMEQSKNYSMIISNIQEFQLEINAISFNLIKEQFTIKGKITNGNTFTLSDEEQSSYINNFHLREKSDELVITLNSDSDTILSINIKEQKEQKIIMLNTESIYDIGNSNYITKTFYFDCPINSSYTHYKINIEDMKKEKNKKPISLLYQFGLINNSSMYIVPTVKNSDIFYLKSSNDYIYQKAFSSILNKDILIEGKSNSLIYYAIKFYEFEKDSQVKISFKGINMSHYEYLRYNRLIDINIKEKEGNGAIIKNKIKNLGSSLLFNYYNCYSKDIHYELLSLDNNNTITKGTIDSKRKQFHIDDINTDYILHFSNSNGRILFNYFYVDKQYLSLFNDNDYKLNYTINPKFNDMKTTTINLQWKIYLSNTNVHYKIYLLPFDSTNECDFLSHFPRLEIHLKKTKSVQMKVEIANIENGHYWIYVIATDDKYHSYKIFDPIELTLLESKTLVKFNMIIMGVILLLLLLPLYKLLTQVKRLVSEKKKKKNEYIDETNSIMLI